MFEKSCHLPVELGHQAYWAIQKLDFDPKVADEKRMSKLNELDEWRLEAYESSNIYKESTKHWHDKHIMKKWFEEGDMVL